MPRYASLRPAPAAALIALAVLIPNASCIRRNHVGDAAVPSLVVFKSDTVPIKCLGLLVSSTDVLTTMDCAKVIKPEATAIKAVLGSKQASLLCLNEDTASSLALVRLNTPLCDQKDSKVVPFQPATDTPQVGDTCQAIFLVLDSSTTAELQPVTEAVTIAKCSESSARILHSSTSSGETVCITISESSRAPLYSGWVLTCKEDTKAVGLSPQRIPGSSVSMVSVVGANNKKDWYTLTGSTDCTTVPVVPPLGTCPAPPVVTTPASPTDPSAVTGATGATGAGSSTAAPPGSSTNPPAPVTTPSAAGRRAARLAVVAGTLALLLHAHRLG